MKKMKNDRLNEILKKRNRKHRRLSARKGRKDIQIVDVKAERRLNQVYQCVKKHPKSSNRAVVEPVVLDEKPIFEDNVPSISAEIAKEEAVKTEKKKKKKKEKRYTKSGRPKSRWFSIIPALLIWLVIICGIVGTVGVSYVAYEIYERKPEFLPSKLEAPESTIVYDAKGNVIQELGEYKRENIDYNKLPNVLIDAFLSIEDARYFEHFGFDIPRFSKAILENLQSMSFAQGGSTFTMQLIKNSYFQIDAGDDSTIAESSVGRKAQEIMLAIEADYKMTKQEILIDYLNRINFGNNIRGIEKAAQYYFGKEASELDLSESAFLAGIINSPNIFNPYNELIKNDDSAYTSQDTTYLENGTVRRNEVLDMMVYHGYISANEAKLAKAVKLEDQLKGIGDEWSDKVSYYQGYIDAVIEEVITKTGLDPYYNSMEIYTNMDPHMQKVVYDIQNENVGIYLTQDKMQSAISIMDNQTGELIALGGGKETGGARAWNRATMSRFQPGSTVKPVLDYMLAFENVGWATTHVITDKPIFYYGGSSQIKNFDGKYYGDITVADALGNSSNTCAIQALEAVIDAKDEDYVVEFLNNCGIPTTAEDFDIQYAIGGNRFAVSPVQLGGLHAVMMNQGKYVEPHTVKKIVFADERKEDYVADTEGKQVVSPGAAFMTATLCYGNVYGPYDNLMYILKTGYPVYAKTGTTDWSSDGYDYGIPYGAIKDSWLVCHTSRFTNVIWTGFDKLDYDSYFYWEPNVKGEIGRYLLDEEYNYFNYEPTYVSQPDDVSTISHTSGVYPYVYDAGNYVTGYILNDFYSTTSIANVSIPTKTKVFNKMSGSLDDNFILTVDWGLSGPQKDGKVECEYDISGTSGYGEKVYAHGPCIYGGGAWADPVGATYKADIYLDGKLITTLESKTTTATFDMSEFATTPEIVLPKPPTFEDILDIFRPNEEIKPGEPTDPNNPGTDPENPDPIIPGPNPKPDKPIIPLKPRIEGTIKVCGWYSFSTDKKDRHCFEIAPKKVD